MHPALFNLLPLGVALYLCVMTSAIPAPPTTTPDPRKDGFFPNPRVHTFECGQSGKISWVCDPSQLLHQDTVRRVDTIIDSIQNSTSCQCGTCAGSDTKGFPIGIAVLQEVPASVEGTRMHGVSTESEAVGNTMVDALRTLYWKLGPCGNDMVLLLSINDGRIYMSVGGVAQRVFHYQCELEVGHTYMTFVRQTNIGEYDKGLVETMQDIRTILTGGRKCLSRGGPLLQWWHLLILSLVVVLVVMVVMSTVMVIRRYRSRPR